MISDRDIKIFFIQCFPQGSLVLMVLVMKAGIFQIMQNLKKQPTKTKTVPKFSNTIDLSGKPGTRKYFYRLNNGP